METFVLTIPNMKSPHCQMTVTRAVNNAGGKVKSILPARAEIELSEGAARRTIIDAVERAGYPVIEVNS